MILVFDLTKQVGGLFWCHTIWFWIAYKYIRYWFLAVRRACSVPESTCEKLFTFHAVCNVMLKWDYFFIWVSVLFQKSHYFRWIKHTRLKKHDNKSISLKMKSNICPKTWPPWKKFDFVQCAIFFCPSNVLQLKIPIAVWFFFHCK